MLKGIWMSTDLIDQHSQIHETAQIGKNVKVGPWCLIGANVTIGDGTVLESHIAVSYTHLTLPTKA